MKDITPRWGKPSEAPDIEIARVIDEKTIRITFKANSIAPIQRAKLTVDSSGELTITPLPPPEQP